MNLVAFSVITRDFYPQFGLYSPGGNSLNFAINFKQYTPGSVAIVGAVGNDEAGGYALEKMKHNSIDISHIHVVDGKTAQNDLKVDADGERYEIDGAWNGGVYDSYVFTDNDWDFINKFDYAATTAYDPQLRAVSKKLKPNMNISVDFLHFGDFSLLEKYIGLISIAFFAGNEALFPSAKKFAQKYPQTPIVITLGAQGSKAFLGKDEFLEPAPKVEKVVDTTGCGDSYQAAFAYTWFTEKNIQLAMCNGTQAAAKTLSYLGGIE